MPYKSTIEDVICILQKPYIQQRKSDASFKEDSLLSSDIVGFFATAKKIDLRQICSRGFWCEKVQTRSKSFAPWITPSRCEYSIFTFFACNLVLVYL